MIVRALVTRAGWAIDDSDYALTERNGREALAIARELGDQELIGRSLGVIGNAMWRTGRLDEARAHYDEGLKIFIALRDPQQQTQFYNNLGVLADSVPDPRAAAENYEKAAALADRANDRYLAATVLGNLAGVYATKGDLPRAERATRRQVALTREIGDTASEVYGLGNLGLYLWAQGKEAEAVQVTRDGAELAAKLGNRRVEAVLLSNLAVAETKLGDLVAARAHGAAALQKVEGLNDSEVERDVHLALAYTQIRDGRLAEAARSIERAEAWRVSARCLLMRARLAYARGDYPRAYDLIRESKEKEEVWLIQNEQMYRAFEESARTGRAASIEFEG
jgi:tetratricopeptide (TPR) repeat protein